MKSPCEACRQYVWRLQACQAQSSAAHSKQGCNCSPEDSLSLGSCSLPLHLTRAPARRNDKAIAPLMQRWREDDYTWAGPKAWACFRPDADVLVPMFYSSAEEGIVSPFVGERVPRPHPESCVTAHPDMIRHDIPLIHSRLQLIHVHKEEGVPLAAPHVCADALTLQLPREGITVTVMTASAQAAACVCLVCRIFGCRKSRRAPRDISCRLRKKESG